VAESRESAQKLVESRRELRIREAKKVMNGSKTLTAAAKTAKCSERTMRRYVEKVAPAEPDKNVEVV
jgi:DNA-directed RNA polymerase subunit F